MPTPGTSNERMRPAPAATPNPGALATRSSKGVFDQSDPTDRADLGEAVHRGPPESIQSEVLDQELA